MPVDTVLYDALGVSPEVNEREIGTHTRDSLSNGIQTEQPKMESVKKNPTRLLKRSAKHRVF